MLRWVARCQSLSVGRGRLWERHVNLIPKFPPKYSQILFQSLLSSIHGRMFKYTSMHLKLYDTDIVSLTTRFLVEFKLEEKSQIEIKWAGFDAIWVTVSASGQDACGRNSIDSIYLTW